MSVYDLDDERAIRAGRLVHDWTKSGLLTEAQHDRLMPQLAVELRRTNKFLRMTLFVFGGVILQSVVGLLAIFLGGVSDAVLCLTAGAACYWLASHLVSRYNLYRFGVEEVAALSAAGLTAVGAALLVGGDGDWPVITGLTTAAAMCTVLYLRFGYVYGAVLALVAGAALPFQFGSSEAIQRLVAVAVLGGAAAAARNARAEHGDDYPGDALAVIEAVAWLGIYLLVNLVISSGITALDRRSTFFWMTYAGIWILPAAGLWLALRGRDRPLLWVNLAAALATLLSNKEYLGSPRYEWDPIVFGLLLMGIAVVVRRWLASGEGGQRHGYTASRLVASDKARLGGMAMVSMVHTDVPVTQAAPAAEPSMGSGGRSGGAGAGGAF